jgi:hypothetical protein
MVVSKLKRIPVVTFGETKRKTSHHGLKKTLTFWERP